MKRLVLTFIVVLLLTFNAFAQDEQPAVDIDWRNLNADVLYLIDADSLATGVGMRVATFEDIVELRVEYAYLLDSDTATEDRNLVGVGLGVSLPGLIEKIGGQWQLPSVVPSLGFIVLVDFADKTEVEVAPYLSVLKVEF